MVIESSPGRPGAWNGIGKSVRNDDLFRSWPVVAVGRIVAALVFVALVSANVSAEPCPGDCDEDGHVAIEELVRAVRMSLVGIQEADCPGIDKDRSGDVSISELIGAVAAAVHGCPSPTATTSASPTTDPPITASASRTPTPTLTSNGCVYQMTPSFARLSGCNPDAEEQLGSVSVTANLPTCCWRAESLNTTLEIVAGNSGCGNDDITYSVRPNTSSSDLVGRIVLFEDDGFNNVAEFTLQLSRGCTRTPTPRGTATPASD